MLKTIDPRYVLPIFLGHITQAKSGTEPAVKIMHFYPYL